MKARTLRHAVMTVETEETIVVRAGAASTRAACPVCRCLVPMTSPEQAARVAGVSPRTIYRWMEAGAVHFIERDSHVQICVPSLEGRTKCC